jgi:hypothetical protein
MLRRAICAAARMHSLCKRARTAGGVGGGPPATARAPHSCMRACVPRGQSRIHAPRTAVGCSGLRTHWALALDGFAAARGKARPGVPASEAARQAGAHRGASVGARCILPTHTRPCAGLRTHARSRIQYACRLCISAARGRQFAQLSGRILGFVGALPVACRRSACSMSRVDVSHGRRTRTMTFRRT